MNITLNWEDFKNRISDYNLDAQYEADGIDSYMIWAERSGVILNCSVCKEVCETDFDDFVDNYKSNWNKKTKTEDSVGIFAPTLDDVKGLYPKKKMSRANITAGEINILDEEVTSEKRICGGEYWIKSGDIEKVHDDDYVEFSVVDKNDVLGLFSYYGLTVGQDVLELVKFVLTDYVKKGNSSNGFYSQLYEGIKGTNKVTPGLFLRIMYYSEGTQDLTFMWRIYYYE